MNSVMHHERLKSFMDRNGLDGLVIRSGENFTYLTGLMFPGTLARHLDLIGSVRSPVLIWPKSGQPEVVLNDFAVGYVQTVSDANIQVYLGYREQPYSKVAERVKELELRRVGLEYNYCTMRDFTLLQDAIPNVEFVDVWAGLEEVRWIKTPGEIALIKKGADLLDDVHIEVLPKTKPQDTERTVHARMIAACIDKGFGWAHGLLNSHRTEVMYCGESDLSIEQGDLIRTDYVAYLAGSGYLGHQSRNIVVGKPSQEIAETYTKVREVYGILMDAIRPGVPVGDLYEKVVAEFEARGLVYSALLIGHSVGPWFHQQEPVLRRGSSVLLEKDMVLALEPYYRSYHIQDMVHVTDNGCTVLSDKINTEKLWVC